MKSLWDLCKPRDSVFEDNVRDDVLDLIDLAQNRIVADKFFEENFLTKGMEELIKSAFLRFQSKGTTSLIRLTQAMGGGKTHSMITLGLLAKNPAYRSKLPSLNLDWNKPVRVVAFTGRESDAPFGIWGSIAEQLGKKEMFNEYYSPLQAPGQSAWINLLKGDPLLILFDELPPYLENALSKTVGNSDLSKITQTALANLFNAVNRPELNNVCVVLSDLNASYTAGSEMLLSTFSNLQNEINRVAVNIEPVGSNTDDIYHILKKRLFETLPTPEEVNEVALEFKAALAQTKSMQLTSLLPDAIYTGIKDNYPFHPSTKFLYERFKENQGFQQTRGLIRIMRKIVSQLYSGDQPKAKEKSIIHVYDFDLHDREMNTMIVQIKTSLSNAISHDICSEGKGIAETLEKENPNSHLSEVAKLLLVSSLADIPNALLGLSIPEILGFLSSPGLDITQIKQHLEDFSLKAWYLHQRDGRLYFQNQKNLIAEINSLVDSYSTDTAIKELRTFLLDKFKPVVGDCYQLVSVFPAMDELATVKEKVTLVLFKPYLNGGLDPDLQAFYDNNSYKNRVMFLSGSRNTMDNLYTAAKEYKAIQAIIIRMREEDKVSEKNPQLQAANDKLDRYTMKLLQSARETFVQLFYPSKDGLLKADFLMQFENNKYNGEDQIRRVLKEKYKFEDNPDLETLRKKCEDRLFTSKEMRWVDILDRAATNSGWQWFHPNKLEDLKVYCIKREVWRDTLGYLTKGPFEEEPTDVQIQEISFDEKSGEATLRLSPRNGEKIVYEIDAPATPASSPVENPNNFKTREMKLSFLCVDPEGAHPTGEPREWKNKIRLKYDIKDTGERKTIQLLSAPPAQTIYYTTDGSNPYPNGATYLDSFEVTKDSHTTVVLAVAERQGIFSNQLSIPIDWQSSGIKVDTTKPIKVKESIKLDTNTKTYQVLDNLEKTHGKVKGIHIVLQSDSSQWMDVQLDKTIPIDSSAIKAMIDHIQQDIFQQKPITLQFELDELSFESGQDFFTYLSGMQKNINEYKQEDIQQ
ncbi:DUF499 domain-containing protein [bacterium]|nr:DUF499 domain-containing protein [bacterium]